MAGKRFCPLVDFSAQVARDDTLYNILIYISIIRHLPGPSGEIFALPKNPVTGTFLLPLAWSWTIRDG
jgi:hypothetical protein